MSVQFRLWSDMTSVDQSALFSEKFLLISWRKITVHTHIGRTEHCHNPCGKLTKIIKIIKTAILAVKWPNYSILCAGRRCACKGPHSARGPHVWHACSRQLFRMVSAPTHTKIILNYWQYLRSLHQNPFAHYFPIFDLNLQKRVTSKRLRAAWKVVTTENTSNTHTFLISNEW